MVNTLRPFFNMRPSAIHKYFSDSLASLAGMESTKIECLTFGVSDAIRAPGRGLRGMYWSYDWGWGLPVLVLTVVAHVYVLVLASEALVPLAPKLKRKRNLRRSVGVLALTALGAAILHGLEAAVWAALYLGIGALTSVQNAMLYSLGAITSYGHAEIFLEDRWKLLGAIEAVNGLILFGLTTAFIFTVIQDVRSHNVSS
jgi:hypothetical protein